MKINNKHILSRKISTRIISLISVLLIVSFLIIMLPSCKPNDDIEEQSNIISLDMIENIPEESLYIEWLGNRGFDVDQNTMILIHGETPDNWDNKFAMTLDNENYVFYSENTSYYNIASGVELDRKLFQYWLNQDYNVGIFHYEEFADDTMDRLCQKLYNRVNMRYKTESGYNNSKTPNYSLTEILAAVYLNEIPDEAYGNEIRLVGNGIGANLALSLSDYLYTYYEKGEIKGAVVPQRVSLIDPYLSTEQFDNDITWREFDTNQSIKQIAEKMLDYTTDIGLVAEVVESVEVTAVMEDGVSVEKLISPYDYKLYNETDKLSKSIKDKVAYLLLRQKYARLYTDNYRQQNRAGLDWYLYSVNGSDDTRVGSPSYTKAEYDNTYCNWGRYNTRPMLNDRVKNNTNTSGKNYALSAWTETVWTRALRGIEFRMKESTGNVKDQNSKDVMDMHNNYVYNYKDHNLTDFRSENYQKAMNMDRTIVAGYVWNDINEDRIMNEGIDSYLGGLTVNVSLSVMVSSETEIVETKTIVTDRDGFYLIEFSNAFKSTHTANVTIVPPNGSYHIQTAAQTAYHIADLTKHSFNKNSKAISITNKYGNAITMASCGLVVK